MTTSTAAMPRTHTTMRMHMTVRTHMIVRMRPPLPGKPCKLSCAEALAAALFICGAQADAVAVMSRFKWRARV